MDTTETIGAWSNPPARGWSRVGAGTGRPLAESFRAAWRGRREVFATCTYESDTRCGVGIKGTLAPACFCALRLVWGGGILVGGGILWGHAISVLHKHREHAHERRRSRPPSSKGSKAPAMRSAVGEYDNLPAHIVDMRHTRPRRVTASGKSPPWMHVTHA